MPITIQPSVLKKRKANGTYEDVSPGVITHVDDALSAVSVSPVENRAVTAAINELRTDLTALENQVNDIVYPASIAITKQPTKLDYEIDESFSKSGMEVTLYYSNGETEVLDNSEISFTPAVFPANGVYTVTISYQREGYTLTANTSVNVFSVRRYGFRREKSNSDCEGRITYLFDAVGKTPAGMVSYSSAGVGTFDPGSWGEFINAVARPVMLKYDGTVDYELDHEDQTKKFDGTASDISDPDYAGNAMVEFKGEYKWVKRYEDTDYEYVIFCNAEYDSDYHAYAHTNDSGVVKDAFYLGMWCGPSINNVLRSIGSGGAVINGQTAEVEITRAKANGTGYNILYKSAWDYVSDLLTLISKTDDSQDAFGNGVDSVLNVRQVAGTLKDKGGFYGQTNAKQSSMKVFWLVDYWGNLWQRMAGCIMDSGVIKTRMTGPYCDTPVSAPDYSTYTDAGIAALDITGTSGNLTGKHTTTDAHGYLPIKANGATNQYIPDSFYYNKSDVRFAFVGAGYNTAANRAGSRCLTLAYAASATYATSGSRLSYIPE